MIVIRVELWPLGFESRKREIGVARIWRTGGTVASGTYEVALLKSPEYASARNVGGVWRKGKVLDFPRRRLGPWDLLFRALRATVADRNKDA